MYLNLMNPTLCENMSALHLQISDLGYCEVDSSWRGTDASPTFTRLYLILEGEITITSLRDGSSITVQAGNSLLLPAGYAFRHSTSGKMRQIYLHVKLCSQDDLDLLRACSAPVSAVISPQAESCVARIVSGGNLSDCLALKSLAMDTISTCLQAGGVTLQTRQYSQQVRLAMDYIAKHLSMKLAIEDIAHNAFLAPSTMTRKFKRETGMSVSQYIDELIFSQAVRMLMEMDRSIQGISDALGFCDQFYFSRKFKQRFGMTPTEYRKMTVI